MKKLLSNTPKRDLYFRIVYGGILLSLVFSFIFTSIQNSILNEEVRNLDLTTVGTSEKNTLCRKIILPASGNQDHRIIGEDIDYVKEVGPQAANPPVFGPHWALPIDRKEMRPFYEERERDPLGRIVHTQEHGHTILWYDTTKVKRNSEDWNLLKTIAKKFSVSSYPALLIVPWSSEDGEPFPDDSKVVLTHWTGGKEEKDHRGIWLYCDEVSGEVVQNFLKEYPKSNSPEPNGM